MRLHGTSLAFGLALVVLSPAVGAQTIDAAGAEQLFEAGRTAMAKRDYAVACQRFRESQRLDPAAGTLINLADCLEKQGLVASSWQAWKEALDSLRAGDDRRKAVEKKLAQVQARVPKLEVKLAEGAPSETTIERDGLVLGSGSLGLPLPVDPGAHRVVVKAPGRAVREYGATLAEGQTQSVVVEPGEAVAASVPPESAPVPTPAPAATPIAAPTPAPAPPPAPKTEAGGNAGRTWGWVAVAVGGAGLVVGGTAGVLALSKKNTMDDDCVDQGGRRACGDAGVDAAHSGRTLATVANVGVALGIVGVGLGAYLVLSSSSNGSSAISAQAGAHTSGITFRQTF